MYEGGILHFPNLVLGAGAKCSLKQNKNIQAKSLKTNSGGIALFDIFSGVLMF